MMCVLSCRSRCLCLAVSVCARTPPASQSYGGHFALQLLDELRVSSAPPSGDHSGSGSGSGGDITPSSGSQARRRLFGRIKGLVLGNPLVSFTTGDVFVVLLSSGRRIHTPLSDLT